MFAPGKPKLGVVSVGHEGTHGGRGREHGAIFDDYPMRFGIVAHKQPATSRKPPDLSRVLKRRNYGEK